MNKSGWVASQWLRTVGISGLAGLVLVMLAFAVFIGLALPAKEKLIRTKSESENLQNHIRKELDNPVDQLPSAGSNLSTFYQSLPPEQNAVKQLEKIYSAADRESLHLTKGEYKFTREKSGNLGRYQVTLPVTGNYIQIRKFIAKVMNSETSVALDGVSFRRESVGGTDLEAKIQFSLFLGVV